MMTNSAQIERLAGYKRIVVKIGSALLVDRERSAVRESWLAALGDDIKALTDRGTDVIVVSSGAIALGRGILGLPNSPLKLEENQAAASVGQIALAQTYADVFENRLLKSGQILLTLADTEERRRYLNARSTINTLLSLGAIPVINENDSVATTEIRYGDNDRLAARVASMVSADCLILLSDVDGLYTAPPDKDANASLIGAVDRITPEIEAVAGDAGSELSRGGMVTKIAAAKIATEAGAAMIIASGHLDHPLTAIDQGGKSTWFRPATNPITARKKWIAGALVPAGSITVDDGAVTALAKGKSLLPAGVRSVSGQFRRGDSVAIMDQKGKEIGRGLIAYDHAEAEKIIGRRSAEIAEILGYSGRSELIHRDDMVMRDMIAL